MANVRNGNTFYVDSTSSGGTATSFINEKQIKVSYIFFTTDNANDAFTINDLNPSTGNTAGDLKITGKEATADDSVWYDFSTSPMVFPNGIWISTLTAGSRLTLVLSKAGG